MNGLPAHLALHDLEIVTTTTTARLASSTTTTPAARICRRRIWNFRLYNCATSGCFGRKLEHKKVQGMLKCKASAPWLTLGRLSGAPVGLQSRQNKNTIKLQARAAVARRNWHAVLTRSFQGTSLTYAIRALATLAPPVRRSIHFSLGCSSAGTS